MDLIWARIYLTRPVKYILALLKSSTLWLQFVGAIIRADGGGAPQVAEARELHIRNCRAAREFLHKGIADVLQIFDSDFAGEIAVQGEIAEKSKEGDTGSETGILLGVCSIRDEIQDFFLLRG